MPEENRTEELASRVRDLETECEALKKVIDDLRYELRAAELEAENQSLRTALLAVSRMATAILEAPEILLEDGARDLLVGRESAIGGDEPEA